MTKNKYDELLVILGQIDADLRGLGSSSSEANGVTQHQPHMSHANCSHANHGNAGKVARAKCRRRRRQRRLQQEIKRAA
jgi:hypothetical protein